MLLTMIQTWLKVFLICGTESILAQLKSKRPETVAHTLRKRPLKHGTNVTSCVGAP